MKPLLKTKINLIVCAALSALSLNLNAAVSYEVIEIKNTTVTEENPTPEDNELYIYSLNNQNLATGYITYPAYSSDANNDGSITADEQIPSFSHAILFNGEIPESGIQDLGTIDNSVVAVDVLKSDGSTETIDFGQAKTNSFAYKINNLGNVVGHSFRKTASLVLDDSGEPVLDSEGNQTAVSKTTERAVEFSNSVVTEIPFFAENDLQDMRAMSLNDNGVIVGFGLFDPPEDVDSNGDLQSTLFKRGFVYDPAMPDQILQLNSESINSTLEHAVFDINKNNIAIARAQREVDDTIYTGSWYFDITQPELITEIPLFNNEGFSSPRAINDTGKIVGIAVNEDITLYKGYLFDKESGALNDLGALIGDEYCLVSHSKVCTQAYGINSPEIEANFQVVGSSLFSLDSIRDTYHAFVYQNGEMKDLNDMIDCKVDPDEEAIGSPDWVLYEARSINDNGWIVGNGLLNGKPRAFMLKPRDTQAIQCQPLVSESDSGSGSVPLSIGIGVILLGLYRVNRRQIALSSR